MKVDIVHADPHKLGTGAAGIIIDQQAVFSQHGQRKCVQLSCGRERLNLCGELPEEVVRVHRVNLAVADGLLQKGIEGEQPVSGFADVIRVPGELSVLYKMIEMAGCLLEIAGGDGRQHRILPLIPLPDGFRRRFRGVRNGVILIPERKQLRRII